MKESIKQQLELHFQKVTDGGDALACYCKDRLLLVSWQEHSITLELFLGNYGTIHHSSKTYDRLYLFLWKVLPESVKMKDGNISVITSCPDAASIKTTVDFLQKCGITLKRLLKELNAITPVALYE